MIWAEKWLWNNEIYYYGIKHVKVRLLYVQPEDNNIGSIRALEGHVSLSQRTHQQVNVCYPMAPSVSEKFSISSSHA